MSSTIMEIDRKYQNISYDLLFREHSRFIYKLIYNFLNAKNISLQNSEVDDIYQEVALKIFKNDYISRYQSEKSSFITWLNIICRTTAIDYYRKKIRWMELVLTDTLPETAQDSIDNNLFSLPAGVLTDRQTQVITLYYREGMVAGEIAAALDITSRTVRSIKFQALERLRNHYGTVTPLDESLGNDDETRRKVS